MVGSTTEQAVFECTTSGIAEEPFALWGFTFIWDCIDV